MLEWMVASVLGILVSGAALLALMAQAHWAVTLVQQQWRADDHHAVNQMLRTELRMAGHRRDAGQRASHDRLDLDSTVNPSLQYRCDACGSAEPAPPASFRLQGGAMSHRGLGTSAHQSLHDPSLSPWSQWRLEQGQTAECTPWVRVTLRPARPANGPTSPDVTLLVRPRNLGLAPCE